MKIYFAGSITGGRGDQALYAAIIDELKKHGTVLTEHIGDKNLTHEGEGEALTPKAIFARDMEWVREADVIVAEVSTPSLGVGYELGQAEALGKPILCLHRDIEDRRLSAMVAGNSYMKITKYENFEHIVAILKEYFEKL